MLILLAPFIPEFYSLMYNGDDGIKLFKRILKNLAYLVGN